MTVITDRLVAVLRHRQNASFDSECHLTNEEADQIIVALEAAITAPDKQEAVAYQQMKDGDWVECSYFVAFGWGDKIADGCRPLYSAPASDDALRAENERLRKALETKPAAFEVLDHVNGTYATTNEQAALATEFPYNGLYRRVGVKV